MHHITHAHSKPMAATFNIQLNPDLAKRTDLDKAGLLKVRRYACHGNPACAHLKFVACGCRCCMTSTPPNILSSTWALVPPRPPRHSCSPYCRCLRPACRYALRQVANSHACCPTSLQLPPSHLAECIFRSCLPSSLTTAPAIGPCTQYVPLVCGHL